ncbi:dTDP-4-dehydrorhamnose 3,5-epimerase family protein [Janthinobacterium fluminis]|uniref:dTDP-4-dehydrorhamnose 3,5-epimerase n=1 Tax=Janthinobacterium fluminis TaxID=2987524 RepID=A0ABT5K2C3_9BURK|nr:dTDP-4-dehydrorhamnose 3,5-epimerase family protein [Janthinobacterium fluminis]MDC8758411.1 dTDP-4-dehydrorhamnose 3,5-epimerase family protein [Janthinobacterium fluminis]
MKTQELDIQGLRWDALPSMRNGAESVVVPMPTTDLVHIVYHGELPFAHGRYGLHRGLEDHLTFLGPLHKKARGYFIDCRTGSPTLHKKVAIEFAPDATRTLVIPCGVAHGFDGLEEIYTINAFRAFLPPPQYLMTDKNPWATGTDIINFPYSTADEALPEVEVNTYPASENFYELLSEMQRATLGKLDYEFPHTEDMVDADGKVHTLLIKKTLSPKQHVAEWEAIADIEGLGWKKHLLVWSNDVAGYAALTDNGPIQIIGHGERHYMTDAYGIHLEWEDRLTFVGPSQQRATIRFIDCRKGSPSEGKEVTHEFSPSALRMLIIPPGVAHAFEGLERIFTINRPYRRSGDPDRFEPGHDVLDWPLDKRPAPSFDIAPPREFPLSYYRALTEAQRGYLALQTEQVSTPAVLLVRDDDGSTKRVALRHIAPASG